MKKILAIMLTVVLALSLAVPAFAAKSVGGTVYFEVIVNKPDTSEGAADGATKNEKVTVKEDGEIEIAIEPVEGVEIKFEGWFFFKQNGSAAKEGVDYKIESVKLSDGTEAKEGVDYKIEDGKVVALNNELLEVSFKPLADGLHVSADSEYVPQPEDDKPPVSPPTADFSMAVAGLLFALVVLSGAATVVAAKRVR